MKVAYTAQVEYDEVDTGFKMKLPVLFQRFQRAALLHSEKVGLGPVSMAEAGGVWIMNRIRVHIRRMPGYGENLTIRTWHKGSAGFRAGRDFLALCDGDTVAAAASQWIYVDLKRKRIAKIPKSVSEPYTEEAEEVLEPGAIDFAVDKTFEPQARLTLTTREGDYDPNGHVNNAVYLEYLDTLVKRSGIACGDVHRLGIQYMKEISRDVHAIQAGLIKTNDRVLFRFYAKDAVYAAGFIG